jgi:hypothetical protein
MPLIASLIVLLLIIPLLFGSIVNTSTMNKTALGVTQNQTERQVIFAASQSIAAHLTTGGGSEQMQQDFAAQGIRVYALTYPETVAGQEYESVRVEIIPTHIDQADPNASSVNNLISGMFGTFLYDPVTGMTTELRYIQPTS